MSPHSLSVHGTAQSRTIAPGGTKLNWRFALRHKVANTPYIMTMTLTKYRPRVLFAAILCCTKNYIFREMGGLCRDGHIPYSGYFSRGINFRGFRG